MDLVFSDLDGTLFHSRTYSWEAAEPALRLLRRRDTPLIFSSSKTRAEMELLRKRLANRHPFIVENGGAVFIPQHYFPFEVPGARIVDGYEVLEFGERYQVVVDTLLVASYESGCRVRGFYDMNAEQIGLRCGLPLAQAVLAKQREYDEPFEIVDSSSARVRRLLGAIEDHGKRWTRGGRFYHIHGDADKSFCVRVLTDLYRSARGPVRSLGLGDHWNDFEFLKTVDEAVVIRSPSAEELAWSIPGARVTDRPGPAGWNEAVTEWVGGAVMAYR